MKINHTAALTTTTIVTAVISIVTAVSIGYIVPQPTIEFSQRTLVANLAQFAVGATALAMAMFLAGAPRFDHPWCPTKTVSRIPIFVFFGFGVAMVASSSLVTKPGFLVYPLDQFIIAFGALVALVPSMYAVLDHYSADAATDRPCPDSSEDYAQ